MKRKATKEENLLIHNLLEQILAFNMLYDAEISVTISPVKFIVTNKDDELETEEFNTD